MGLEAFSHTSRQVVNSLLHSSTRHPYTHPSLPSDLPASQVRISKLSKHHSGVGKEGKGNGGRGGGGGRRGQQTPLEKLPRDRDWMGTCCLSCYDALLPACHAMPACLHACMHAYARPPPTLRQGDRQADRQAGNAPIVTPIVTQVVTLACHNDGQHSASSMSAASASASASVIGVGVGAKRTPYPPPPSGAELKFPPSFLLHGTGRGRRLGRCPREW